MLFIYSYRTLVFFIPFLNGNNISIIYEKENIAYTQVRERENGQKTQEVKEASSAGFSAPAPGGLACSPPSCILWFPFDLLAWISSCLCPV